jgi:hypothetical protein
MPIAKDVRNRTLVMERLVPACFVQSVGFGGDVGFALRVPGEPLTRTLRGQGLFMEPRLSPLDVLGQE